MHSIFGFVLGLIFLITIQQALALSVNIDRATAGLQSISPGGNISLISGSSIPVTFTYNGSRPDTQNPIGQFIGSNSGF